jgi:Fic family protein
MEVHEGSGMNVGYATTKRILANLAALNHVQVQGRGRATTYSLSPSYAFTRPFDVEAYFEREIDDRTILQGFNLELLSKQLPGVRLFTDQELEKLEALHATFRRKVSGLSAHQYAAEMERLAIDLSWKSSQIEGNTYSLLETERLLRDQLTAEGRTPEEATMLLNHKAALDFLLAQPDYLNPLKPSAIEDIHGLLVKNLNIQRNVRMRGVGITGTNYKPLDNVFQIQEAMADLCRLVNSKDNVFEKALLLLVLISYIQPFEDGNKRTARLVSNGCLIYFNHCPLSFRTVDSLAYKKAMLVFYEQNNLSPFKSIFIEQYAFAVETYF